MLGYKEQEKLIDNILNTFEGDMARIILEMERLIQRFMFNTNLSTKEILDFTIMFNEALVNTGYYEAVNKMVGSDYDKLLPLVIDSYKMGGFITAYTADDLTTVMALKALEANKFSVMASSSATTLRDNLYRYSLGSFTKEDMTAQLIEDFRGTNISRYANTLANTAITEFNQSVVDTKAEGLDGVWVYIGVFDSVTRDYCKCILKKKHYYTREEKAVMQNDYKRKYRCRHIFKMVTPEWAELHGYSDSTGVDCV